jgi:hypothetical protein
LEEGKMQNVNALEKGETSVSCVAMLAPKLTRANEDAEKEGSPLPPRMS